MRRVKEVAKRHRQLTRIRHVQAQRDARALRPRAPRRGATDAMSWAARRGTCASRGAFFEGHNAELVEKGNGRKDFAFIGLQPVRDEVPRPPLSVRVLLPPLPPFPPVSRPEILHTRPNCTQVHFSTVFLAARS